MANSNTVIGTEDSSGVIHGISELAVVIGLTMFLPFVVHLIPSWDDSPIGGKLLPIFYAPLIAALTRKWHVSVIASIVSPWLNYFIFGSPSIGMAALLSLQLVPFCWFAYYFGQKHGSRFWVGPAAFLISKPFVLILFVLIPSILPRVGAFPFVINTTVNAIPGIIILGLLSYLTHRMFPPSAHA